MPKKIDYKREYEKLNKEFEELLQKYEYLEQDYMVINNELYSIKNSRSYKMTFAIRKANSGVRRVKRMFKNNKPNYLRLKKYLNNTKRLIIIPSSFEFDEFVNQRPINFSKYMADHGYKVLFVVWQWNEDTKINNNYKEVYSNVFQIALYDFLNTEIDYSSIEKKVFSINFPHKLFLDLTYKLRPEGFIIHYDIMDEWEEFKKFNQADWHDLETEKKIILEADCVNAVSSYLVDKFSNIRKDIALSPNGYYKKLTGEKNRDIALKEIKDDKINIGYFGHLTDSWFDWKTVIDLAKKNKNYVFHIIGYGLPDNILEKINNIDNINFYGKVPTNQLHEYVRNWNIGMILFKPSKLAKAVDPIKIYEYLFMGLPSIVSGIESIKNYPMVHYINNEEEFNKSVKEIIAKKTKDNIDKFLEESTWEARFDKIVENYEVEGISVLYEK